MVVFSFAIAFFGVHEYESTTPIGPSHTVHVYRPKEEKTSYVDVNDAIGALSSERRVDVARVTVNREDPSGAKDIYVLGDSGGSFASSWERGGYRAFDRETVYHVHTVAESRLLEPSGLYLFSGSDADASAFTELLQGYGYTVIPNASAGRLMAMSLLGSGYAHIGFTAVSVLLVVSLVGVGVLLNSRASGIERLQGIGAAGIWRLDAGRMLRLGGITAGIALALSLVALGVYNRFHFLTMFLLATVGVAVMMILVASLMHLLMLRLLGRTPIVMAIKGEQATPLAGSSVYVLKLFTVFLAVIVASMTVSGALSYTRLRGLERQWASAKDFGVIHANLGISVTDNATRKVGGWLASLDADGGLVRALYNPGGDVITVDGGAGAVPVLYVNARFLDFQPLTDTGGQTITGPTDPHGLTVIIPEQWKADTDSIVAQADDTAVFMEEDTTDDSGHACGGGGSDATGYAESCDETATDNETSDTASDAGKTPPANDVRYMARDASVFTYYVTSNGDAEPQNLSDAIIMVSANDTDFMNISDYAAYATQYRVFVTDCQEATRQIAADSELSNDVFGVSPAMQDVADQIADARNDLVTTGISCILSLAILVTTTIAFAVTYTRRRGQFIFATFISGWSFRRTFGRLVTGDTIMLLATCAAGYLAQNAMFASDTTLAGQAGLQTAILHAFSIILSVTVFLIAAITLVCALRNHAKAIVRAQSADVG